MSNTITAFFKGRVGVAEAVYQNDYGIVMNFDSIELPAHFDCYFSVMGEDEAIPGIGADNQVVIPNGCLSRSGSVTLHIPLHTGANDSEVEYIVYFKVIGRARPVDDGTPAQMTAIEQALALLQNPIGNIEQIVNEALAFTGDTFAEMQEALDADQTAFETEMGARADSFESGISSRQSQVESDFHNLDAQFQAAVSAVTTDTEVTNIRVGADDVTYSTAGEAVRTQLSNARRDLGEETYNMFSVNKITAYYNMVYDGKRFTNTVADTKNYVAAQLLLYTGSTLNEVIPFSSVSLGRTVVTFVPQSDADTVVLRHAGSRKDLGIGFSCSLIGGTTYNASFYCSQDKPNIVGGLNFYDVQVEQSATASQYMPHVTATDYVARSAFMTPEDFGAVGDGVTDDTLAIQNAITFVVFGSNRTIRLKGKTYKISGRLSFQSNLRLIGEEGATLLWDTISGEDALFAGTGLHDISIENIAFDFGTQSVLRYGISLINSYNISVKKCSFTHGYGYAWRINNDYNVVFEDCSFNSITGGAGNPGGGIFGSNFHDVRVSKCSCDTIDDHFVYIAGTTESYNVTVENCICYKTGQNGLTNGSAICVYALAHDVVIAGNIIRQCASGIYVGKYGEYTTLPQNIVISNNIISFVTQNGIHIEGLSDSVMVTRLSIVGNVVRSSAQDAIKLIYSAYVTCAENVVAFPTRYGIALDRVAYSTFTGNVITEVTNTALMVGVGSKPCIYCKFDNMFLMQATGEYASYGLYSRNANYCEYVNVKAIGFATNYVYGGGALNSYINSQSALETKSLYFTSDISRADYHNVGDVVIASNPTVGNPVMWICTEAGAPGIMTPMVTL